MLSTWRPLCWIHQKNFGKVSSLFLSHCGLHINAHFLSHTHSLRQSDDRFQPEYERTLKYLDVDSRIGILNNRLDVLKNLNQILMDAAHNQHASVLEWIIIILIVAEILIDLFRAWRDID